MNVAAWAQRHARSILFLLAVLAAGGVYATFLLPVSLFPHVDFPRVRISLDAGDRPADQMAVDVTTPIEEAVRAIPGVRSVRSTTSRGSAEINVNFDWGRDMPRALLEVSAQVSRTLPDLPAGTAFDAIRLDPTVFPVIAYSLTSDTRSPVELQDLALYQLRPALSAVNGVAKIGVQGGAAEEFRVVVDPGKLQSFGMTLDDVAAKLSAANVVRAVGRLQDHGKLYLVLSDTRFTSLAEVEQTVLRAGPTGVVLLGDVADVRRDTAPVYTRVTADGHDAVLFQVYQQPDGNTVQIAADVKAKLADLEKSTPILADGSVKVANWYDQSDLVLASEHSTRDAILIGIGLAAVVLFVFLRNWKITLIAIVAVPAVLAATILLLYARGMSFNVMTLGGMAAAVGLIIDDAIVMVEHITRRLHEGGRRGAGSGGEEESGESASSPRSPLPATRIVDAAREFTRPLVGSSLSTIVIFVPLAFLSGVTGAFFKALSLTMASGLAISFVVAWLAVPSLAARLLGETDARPPKKSRAGGGVVRGYGWTMGKLLPTPWLALLIVLPLAAVGYLALTNLPTGFLPSMDEGGFILDYVAPPGTSLVETDRMLRQVEEILQQNPAVQTYSRRTGLQLSGSISEANLGDFFVRLKPFPRPPIEQVMADVRAKAAHAVPGLEIETAQLMEDLIGDLTAVPQPIEIKLYNDDEKTLQTVAPRVADAIGKVAGVVEVKDGIVPAGDALQITVDRTKAALEGLDPDAVTTLIDDAVAGNVTTQILRVPKQIGVRVWLPASTRATERDIRTLALHAPGGKLVPLSRVATITTLIGQPEIDRDDLKRIAAVTARISGRDLGSTVAEVKAVLDKPGLLPAGMTYELGGLYKQQQIAFAGQTRVLIAALLLVFVLLLFLYESFRIAVAVLGTTLLAVAGVLIGMWLTGTELNITSIMGLTMVVGIVTEVGIFYVSEWVDLPDTDSIDRRLTDAGVNRMRAIAMTTLAAILALLPLALGIGQGAALLQPLAVAIIAGLTVQFPLVLIVLPALLRLTGAGGAGRAT